jgi:myotubularin-related protein 3/4
LSLLENSKWFTYLNAILKAAVVAVSAIDKEGKPVLVHCSDGWDRTTQIIALAELLLDPYYRTVEVS